MILEYELSNEADLDLDDIFDYTEKMHGLNQAIKYLTFIEDNISNLCEFPYSGRLRSEIKQNIYSFVVKEHLIFYEIRPEKLFVVRILHARKDMPRHLNA